MKEEEKDGWSYDGAYDGKWLYASDIFWTILSTLLLGTYNVDTFNNHSEKYFKVFL